MIIIGREALAKGMKPMGASDEVEAVMEMVMAYTPADWARLAAAPALGVCPGHLAWLPAPGPAWEEAGESEAPCLLRALAAREVPTG